MNQDHAHGAATRDCFTEPEWSAFQAEDRRAAGVVAALMTGIFSIGLCIYLIVCWSVS